MARCPTCQRTVPEGGDAPSPFCSQRCKLVDLDNWLGNRYVVSDKLPFAEAEDELPAELIEELLRKGHQ